MPDPKLTITNGQTVTIPARTHLYSEIDIQTGGVLKILDQSSQWCILHCMGNVTIQGKIQFENFVSQNGPFSAITPDGTNLSYDFPMISLGGDGGNGGISRSRNQTANGGNGAAGTKDYGGGGGSGGGFTDLGRTAVLATGNSSNDYRGARSVTLTDGKGGDGARKNRWANGGLLFIFCGGDFDGSNGLISLNGSNGDDGQNGERSHFDPVTNTYFAGCGGGGGGASGGDGGICKIKVTGTTLSYPAIDVNSGKGGKGGNGGQHLGQNNGENGKDGEDGQNGFVDYLN